MKLVWEMFIAMNAISIHVTNVITQMNVIILMVAVILVTVVIHVIIAIALMMEVPMMETQMISVDTCIV